VIAYNTEVRSSWLILLLAASLLTQAQQSAPVAPASANATPAISPASPSAAERRRAQREFHEAVRLQSASEARQALDHFELAASLAPDNLEYVTAREVARQKLVYHDLELGNQALADGNQIRALGLFQEALHLDPQNEFARQRVRDSLPRLPALGTPGEQNEFPEAIQLQPAAGQRNFHLRGNARDIVNQVALAYGVTAVLDNSFPSRQVRFDLEEADWTQAFMAVTRVTKSLWTPLSPRQALFAADTDENRRSLLQNASATFYLPQAATPQALNDIVSALRVLFEIRFVTPNPKANSITIRADAATVKTVGEFLRELHDTQPEVVFDIQVFQVSRTYARALGASIPTQFQLFNIPSELQSALSNSNVQSLINQLISSGLINQAATTAIAGLIGQLLGQQQNGLLSQPFAVFGGGITFSALTIPAASLNFSRDESLVRSLQAVTVRASQATAAVLKVGQRYPILNSTFSPIFNSSAIAAVLGNQSYIAPFPSFNYEDLGFNLKATPIVHRDNSVGIKLEMNIRSLGAQVVNGIPIVNNREFNGYITAPDGESIIVVSNLTKSEGRMVTGWPVPPLKSYSNQETDDEMLVVLTPHVVVANPEAGPTIPVPSITATRPATR
jgi:tetratricopeptide (TPR) repeat protein